MCGNIKTVLTRAVTILLALIILLGTMPASSFAADGGVSETGTVTVQAVDASGKVLQAWNVVKNGSVKLPDGYEYDASKVRGNVSGYGYTGKLTSDSAPETGTIDVSDADKKDVTVKYIYEFKPVDPEREKESVKLKQFWTTNAYQSEKPITLVPDFWADYNDPDNIADIFTDDSVLWGEYNYEPVLVSLSTPSGGSYVWKDDPTSSALTFTPTKADEGKQYVATYRVRKWGADADGKLMNNVTLVRYINISQPTPAVTERVRFKTVPVRNVDCDTSETYQGPVKFMPDEWTDDPMAAFADNSIFEEGYTYEPFIKTVTSPTGGSYTYQNGDTEFIPREQDKDKVYTVTYGVYRIKNGTKEIVEGVETEGKIIVIGDRETIDRITGDDVRVSRLSVEVLDGTDPFDSNTYDPATKANKGEDNGKTNGVVRTFDSIDYNLKFSTESKDPRYNYKEGYMRFEVDLPKWSDQEAAFDFGAMNYMESGKDNPYDYEAYHYGKINGQDVKLTSDNKMMMVNEDGSETEIELTYDGSGEINGYKKLSGTLSAEEYTNQAAKFKQTYRETDDFGQKLIFYYHLTQTVDTNGNVNNGFPSTGTIPVVINVLRMANDDKIQPSFKASVVQEQIETDANGDPVLDAKGQPVIKDPEIDPVTGKYNIIYEATEDQMQDTTFPDWQHNTIIQSATVKEVVVTCKPSYAIRLQWAEPQNGGRVLQYDFDKTAWTAARLADYGVAAADQGTYVGKDVYYITNDAGIKQYVKQIRSGFDDNGNPQYRTIPITSSDAGAKLSLDANAPNKGIGTYYGRMATLGVAIQLFNYDVSKGLRGIEFPKEGEPIEFDIKFDAKYKNTEPQVLAPILYDGGANHYEGAQFSPNTGRDVYAAKGSTTYAYRAAPYNYYTDTTTNQLSGEAGRYDFKTSVSYNDRCWWGGNWEVTQNSSTVGQGHIGQTSSVHVKVTDFVINPNWFPVKDVGIVNSNTGLFYYQNATGAANTNVGTFSAGEIHMLIPHSIYKDGTMANDYYVTTGGAQNMGTGDVYFNAEFTNFKITSQSGDTSYNLSVEEKTGDTKTGVIQSQGGQDDYSEQTSHISRPGGWTEYIWYTHKDNFVHANASDRARNIANVNLGTDGVSNMTESMADTASMGGKVGIIWSGNSSTYGDETHKPQTEFMMIKFDGSVLTPITDDNYRQPHVVVSNGSAANNDATDTTANKNYNPNSQAYNEPIRNADGSVKTGTNANGQAVTLYKFYKEYRADGSLIPVPAEGAYIGYGGADACYSSWDALNAKDNTTYKYGYIKGDHTRNWSGQYEMSVAHKDDLDWYDAPLGGNNICVAMAADTRSIGADTVGTNVYSIAYFKVTDEITSTKRTSFSNPTLPADGTNNVGYVASCEVNGYATFDNGSPIEGHVSSAPEGDQPLDLATVTAATSGFEKADWSSGAYKTTDYMACTMYYRGDSLRLVPYNTTISKSTVQQIYDKETGKWVAKTTWNTDNAEERIVDFVLAPQFNTQGVIHDNDPTWVYIEDILPANMTYREGSSVWILQMKDNKGYPVYKDTKGTNDEGDDEYFSVGDNGYYFVSGDPASGFKNRGEDKSRAGITSNDEIVYDGEYIRDIEGLAGKYKGGTTGTECEPYVIEELDGNRTRLVWRIHSDNIGDFLPRIYYSTDVSKEAGVFASSLSNTAKVTSGGELKMLDPSYDENADDAQDPDNAAMTKAWANASSSLGNLATATVNLVTPALIMTLKIPDKAATAPGGDMTYTLQYANANADTDWNRAIMLDTLPTNQSDLWKLEKETDPDITGGDSSGYYYKSATGTHVGNYNMFSLENGSADNPHVPFMSGTNGVNVTYTLPTLQEARKKVYIKDYVFYYTDDPLASQVTSEMLSTDYYNLVPDTDSDGKPIDGTDKDGNTIKRGELAYNAWDKSADTFTQKIVIDGVSHDITWYKATNTAAGETHSSDVTLAAGATDQIGQVSGLDSLSSGKPVTAFFLYGTMKASSSIKANMGVMTTGSEAGDVFTNLASVEGNIGPADGKIVDRILSGTVWFDEDMDGIRDDDETVFSNVTALLERYNVDTGKWEEYKDAKIPKKLYIKNGDSYVPFSIYDEDGNQIYTVVDTGTYKTITDEEGNVVELYDEDHNPTYEFYEKGSTTLTDENGYYEFRGLEEGRYRVTFRSTDNPDDPDAPLFDIGKYRTTVADVNNQYTDDGKVISKDGTRDSDGLPAYDSDGKLVSAAIEKYAKNDENGDPIYKIEFPKTFTNSPYRIDYQDLGLTPIEEPEKELDENGSVSDKDSVVVGQRMPYVIRYSNDNATNFADITITDVIDKGLTVDVNSISDKGRFYPDETGETGGKIVWRILKVPPVSGEETVSFTAVVNENAKATGKVQNKASVSKNYYKDDTPIPDEEQEDPTGSVIVQHVTTDGTVLIPWTDVIRDGDVGTPYTTHEETFPGYRLVKVDTDNYDEPEGTVIEGTKRVVYVYELDPDYDAPTGSVVVRYVTEDGDVLEDWSDVVKDAEPGTTYSTHIKQFDGYELVRVDDNPDKPLVDGGEDYSPASGEVESDTTKHVTYVYRKKDKVGSVVVEHRAIKSKVDPSDGIRKPVDSNDDFIDTSKSGWYDDVVIIEVMDPWEDVIRDGAAGTAYSTNTNDYQNYVYVGWDRNYDNPSGNVEADKTKEVVYLYMYDDSPNVGDVIVEHRAVKVDSNGNPVKDADGNYVIERILEPWADVERNAEAGTDYDTTRLTDNQLSSGTTYKYQVEIDDPDNPGTKKTVWRPYDYLRVDENYDSASGQVEAGKTKKVVYLYIPADTANPPETPSDAGSVKVKYVWEDEDGNIHEFIQDELKDLEWGPDWNDVLTDVEPGTEYSTVKERIDGYTFSRMGDNSDDPEGEIEANKTKEVVYVYRKNPTPPDPADGTGGVVVRHVLEDGTVLEGWTDAYSGNPVNDDSDATKVPTGTNYSTYPKNFVNPDTGKKYELVQVDDDESNPIVPDGKDYSPASGKVEKGEVKHVTYVYKEVPVTSDDSGSAVVEYRSTTGEILKPWQPAKTEDGEDATDVPDGTKYTTSQEDFKGYRFVKVDTDNYDDPEGDIEDGKVKEVVYLYEPMAPGSGDVRVKHVAIKTDENGNPLDKDGNVTDDPAKFVYEEVLADWEDVYRDAPDGTEYSTTKEYFDGYELVVIPDVLDDGVDPAYDDPNGYVQEGKIKSVVYLYRKIVEQDKDPTLGDVVVEHRAVKLDASGQPQKDADGNYIIETVLEPWSDVVRNAPDGTNYSTSEKTFTYTKDGETYKYKLLEVDSNYDDPEGQVKKGKTKHVVYLYVPEDKDNPPEDPDPNETGSVKVKYVWEDENGDIHEFTEKELADTGWDPGWNDVVTDVPDGTDYKTNLERFPGYEFKEMGTKDNGTPSDNPDGKVEKGKTKEVVYVYKKTPGSVTVEHRAVDEDGNVIKILEPKAYVKDENDKELKDVPGGTPYDTDWLCEDGEYFVDSEGNVYERYQMDPDSDDPEGKVESGTSKTVIYTYKKVPLGSVIVKHVVVDGKGNIVKTLEPWRDAFTNEKITDQNASDASKQRGGTEYSTDPLTSTANPNGNPVAEDGVTYHKDSNGNLYELVRVDTDYDDPAGSVEENWTKRVVYVYKLKSGTPDDPDNPYDPPEGDEYTPPMTIQETKDVENPTPDKRYSQTTSSGANQSQVAKGDVIEYEIFYGNAEAGPVEVVITDKIDAGLDIVKSSLNKGGSYNASNRTITWKFTAAAGEYGSVKFKAKINKSAVNAGKIQNTAKVKVGNHPAVDTRTLVNPVPAKRYAAESAAGKGGATVKVGDVITYEIPYKQYKIDDNYEKITSVDITITDVLDPGLTVDTSSLDGNAEFTADETGKTGGTIVWTIRDVPYGTESSVKFSAEVNDNAYGKTVENYATIEIGNGDKAIVTMSDSKETNKLINPVEGESTTTIRKVVKTGDNTGLVMNLAMFIAAIVMLIYIKRSSSRNAG